VIVLALAGGLGWWWYQQRQATPATTDGGVETIAATAEGQLLIDARPWGHIEKVVDTASGTTVALPAGSPFTPRLAALPEGAYEITVSHPDAGSRSCRVDVTTDQRPTCEVRFFDTDPRAYFMELGW